MAEPHGSNEFDFREVMLPMKAAGNVTVRDGKPAEIAGVRITYLAHGKRGVLLHVEPIPEKCLPKATLPR